MNTPIADFINEYIGRGAVRAHMPGHKGRGGGIESGDITEIDGADSLYEASGIIAESERNAALLFGTRNTFYSAGGSSQSIKAMCLLACRNAVRTGLTQQGKRPVIMAARNAHTSFVRAAQTAGFDITWLAPEDPEYSLCRCRVTHECLTKRLEAFRKDTGTLPAAVYITSPDYLGNIADIPGLASAAHSYGVPLLTDNAHGAYLRFLPDDIHPISLGADACADSAHKTLPVLTGGGYLHISMTAPERFERDARPVMSMFGSSSPSYLILRSLDEANKDLASERYSRDLARTAEAAFSIKNSCEDAGLVFEGDEPLKLTVNCRASGTGTGCGAAAFLRSKGIECEFADNDFCVLMISPGNTEEEFLLTRRALLSLSDLDLSSAGPLPALAGYDMPKVRMMPRDIMFKDTETILIKEALGRTAAYTGTVCPPAVAPVISGEIIDDNVIRILEYYGISEINVLAGREI